MTTAQTEHFKERLLEEKTRLEQELSDIGSRDPNNPGHFEPNYPESGGSSVDDNAAEVSEYADGLSIEAKLESELRDVQKALKLIEEGAYGVCKYCGKDIDPKRLEARPASSSCIECKKLLTQEM
jgi:RNA polymerase-binding protein DksA